MHFAGEEVNYCKVREFVGLIFGQFMHSKRLDSIAGATLGVIASASLIVHRIGLGLAHAMGLLEKHAIKQVDRLLSNDKFDLSFCLERWVKFIVDQHKDIQVVLDWTNFDSDQHATLTLSLVTSPDFATPLLWRTVDKRQFKNKQNNYENELLLKFKGLIPENTKVTVIADREFCDIKLFEFLKELGFNYNIRFQVNMIVTNQLGESKKAIDWAPASGKTKVLRKASLTAKAYPIPTVLCVKQKEMKQAWCIACSDEKISGLEVVRWYAKRGGYDPHLDAKNFHFSMDLSETHIKNKDRRDRLLLIAAISIALLTLFGTTGRYGKWGRKSGKSGEVSV